MTSRAAALSGGRRACVTTTPPWRRGQQALLSLAPPTPPRPCLVSNCLPSNEPHDTGDRICCHHCVSAPCPTPGTWELRFACWLVDGEPVWVELGFQGPCWGEDQHGGRGWPPLSTILPGEVMRLSPECSALSQALHCPPRESLKPCSHASIIFPSSLQSGPEEVSEAALRVSQVPALNCHSS